MDTLFTGKVKNIRYYETAKEKYSLLYVEGVEKPLAIPRRRTYPAIVVGDHVSAADITEGDAWYFCFPRETLVLGDNKTIDKYQQGDGIIDGSGLLCPVLGTTQRQFYGSLVEVRASGLLPFQATPEHPVLAFRRTWRDAPVKLNWKDIHELSPVWYKPNGSYVAGDYLAVPRLQGTFHETEIDLTPFTNAHGLKVAIGKGVPLSFPINEETMGLLGLYLAEGHVNDHWASWTVGRHETDLIDFLQQGIKRLGYTPSTNEAICDSATTISSSSHIISRAFEAWFGRGATKKHIPDWVLFHTNLLILRSFLDWYYRGDGYVNKRKMIEGSTVSKVMALQLQLAEARFGNRLDLFVDEREYETTILGVATYCHTRYRFRVNPKPIRRTHIVTDRHLLFPVRRITAANYSGLVHNLQTSSETYCVSNVVVHNCGHRSVVKINEKQFEVWKPKTKADPARLLQAQILVLEYARTHEDSTTQLDNSNEPPSGVCSNDVSTEIQDMFPERDRHIVGPIFLSLSKLKLIHPYGSKPSQPKEDKGKDHGSPIPVWHLTKNAKTLWESYKDWTTVIEATRKREKKKSES